MTSRPEPFAASVAPAQALPAPMQPSKTRPIESPDIAPSVPRPADRRTDRRHLSNLQESALLFALFYVIYAAIGYRLVVVQHLIGYRPVMDGLPRLAHAYFAWYNQPPKLAAIGFEWPPLMTLVFLPLAAIKPLATSFAALPLTSAIFGAGLLVILNRTLSTFGMRPLLRYPLVVLFGANPMIVFYATNGMAESVYLFFLTASIYFLVRWYRNQYAHVLAMAGAALALGTLSRYEIAAFAMVIGVGVAVVLGVRRVSRQQISGSLTLYAAPIAYALGAWCFFNWLILGNPFYWLQRQQEANTSQQVVAQQGHTGPMSLVQTAEKVISLNAHLFPLTLVVIPALLLAFILRRDLMALILAVLASLNALMTIYLINSSGNPGLLQLRYNMRAMPIALVGMGWLFWLYRGWAVRASICLLTAATLAISLPITWHTMQTYPYQFAERAFVRAVQTGRDQLGTRFDEEASIRDMSGYVGSHVSRQNSVLTDDAQTFGVMLAGGRPDLFYDRIDHGDKHWMRVLRSPYGKVEYILVAKTGYDIIHACYPRIFAATMPGMHLVHQSSDFKLLRVARLPPRRLVPPSNSPQCSLPSE